MLTEFNKYTLSSFISFLLDFCILYTLTEKFNIFYLYSAILATSIGFTLNYLINIKWVFEYRRFKDRPLKEYIFMSFITASISMLNIMGLWFLSYFLNVHYLLSKILSSLISFFLKFIYKKKILF